MTREIALHCMKAYSELHSELCELCPIYGQTGSDHCFEDALQYVIERLEQEPKTGHWIEHPHEAGANWEFSMYECSECHVWEEDDSNFCPNCGCRMVEPQESEDKA